VTALSARAGERPVLIAGGGIGGLAAAVGLARRGIRSVVLEKAASLGEIGAGIQLGPNAFHAFDYLGVGEAARAMAVFIDQLRLMDAVTGEEITHIDLGEGFRSRFRNPYAVVHRGDLHKIFVKACQSHALVELRIASEVVGYDQDGSSVTVQLVSGQSLTGSFLIGADGLWSNIRKKVVGDGTPRVSGHSTYRSVIPTEQMPKDLRWNAATLWAGPKCHIVHYPLSGWKVFNLVATYHNEATEPVAGKPVADSEVMRGFLHVHDHVQRIVRRGKNWKQWVLCDRDPVENWVDGRVVLLGDAAHPMMQYFAQGACMAWKTPFAWRICSTRDQTIQWRRCNSIAINACCAPLRSNCSHARLASTFIIPRGHMRCCAVRSCELGPQRTTSMNWCGSMVVRESAKQRNFPKTCAQHR
jgi:2-polyprenyl-6-methoxyphenol hydroxylase-like FAD-dependent oxidoreductase